MSFSLDAFDTKQLKNRLSTAQGEEKVRLLNQLSEATRNSEVPLALDYAKTALKEAQNLDNKELIAISLLNIGVIYRNVGQINESITYFRQVLQIGHELNHTELKADALHKIGTTYLIVKEFDEAKSYIMQEIELWKNLNNEKGMCAALNALGLTLLNLSDDQQAEKILKEALDLAQKLQDNELIYKPLVNLGELYLRNKEADKAITYILESQKICQQTGNKNGIAVCLMTLGEAYQLQKKYDLAQKTLLQAVEQAKSLGTLSLLRNSYRNLAQTYEADEKYRMALEHYRLYISLEDSMFGEITKRKIAETEAKYSLTEKDREIELLNQQAEYDRLRFATTLGGMLLAFAIVLLLVNRYNNLKNSKLLLSQKQSVLDTQTKELVIKQELLAQQHNKISEIISYARSTQKSLLPTNQSFMKIFTDFFVEERPIEEVGGDFCWFAYKSDSIIIIVADCWGTGVFGALNTIIINALSAQIINETQYRTPADLLKEINKQMIAVQPLSEDAQMQMAILNINAGMQKMLFASSGIPLYYLKDGQVQQINPDKLPLGKGQLGIHTFTNHRLTPVKGGRLFLFTDGVANQKDLQGLHFGEENIKELLTKTAHPSLQKQKEQVCKAVNEWKGQASQNDDMLFFGVEFP